MKISLARTLHCSPETAFGLLTIPDLMNEWSTARIVGNQVGDGGTYYGVGATRQVYVPGPRGRKMRLDETIEISEPPHKLVYRVLESSTVKYHRGEITCTAMPKDKSRTNITWDVEFQFTVPGAERLAKPMLERELNRSLDTLESLAGTATVPHLVRSHWKGEKSLAPLYRAAEKTLKEQRENADELFAAQDPRRWFARVYEYVTEEQIRRCREGLIEHAGWTLRLIPVFHRYWYDENYVLWGDGNHAAVGTHWQDAFRAMEGRRRGNDPKIQFARGLKLAIIAHIEEDLPRALAEVYLKHYRDQCDYVRYRADYLLMADVFRTATRRMLDHIPADFMPGYARALTHILPGQVLDKIMEQQFYNIARQRLRTFERGLRLTQTFARI